MKERTIEFRQTTQVDLSRRGPMIVFNTGHTAELPAEVARLHVGKGQARVVGGDVDSDDKVTVEALRSFTATLTVSRSRWLQPGESITLPGEVARQYVASGAATYVDGGF